MLANPPFFNISVIHTFKPSFINEASACAGVVADTAEEAKDEKQEKLASKAGGVFVPLVELFGI